MIEIFNICTQFFSNLFWLFLGIIVLIQTLWALACIILSGTENFNPDNLPALFLNMLIVGAPSFAIASWLSGHHPIWGILAVSLISLLALNSGVWNEIVKDFMYFTDKTREGRLVHRERRVVEATLINEPRTAKNDATWTAIHTKKLMLLPPPTDDKLTNNH
jgi:hypothetical protein